jgi:hypothetical protein
MRPAASSDASDAVDSPPLEESHDSPLLLGASRPASLRAGLHHCVASRARFAVDRDMGHTYYLRLEKAPPRAFLVDKSLLSASCAYVDAVVRGSLTN